MANETPGQGENLVVVYRALDEAEGILIRGLLAGEDIPALLESRQVAWMDGVMKMGEGYWGDVVVPEEYANRSRELIAAYQQSNINGEDATNGDDQPKN
jgi:hypothetical protein